MTTSIATPPKLQFFSSGGVPLSGGKLYSYAAGTTTPLATYTSSTGSIANTNPVILDSRGEADVWFGTGQYKLKLTSSTDVEIWTVDNLNGPDQATLATLAASSGSSLVGYIQAGGGAVATTVQARLRKLIFTSDYDTFANALAAAANGTLIINSTNSISSNTTVPSTVVLQASNGGLLNIATSVTLTINGSIECGAYKIFNCTGTGNVKIGPKTPIVYAEWWGTTNDGTSNDGVAIQAACDALSPAGGILQLLNRKYYISALITVTTQALTIQGTTLGLSPYDYGSGGPWGTQIVGTNGVNGIRVYNVGYFSMKNVEMYLLVGATTACYGLLLDSCFLAKVDDCRINNYSTAIKMITCTDPYIYRCYLASVGVTVSPVVGVDIDGTTTQNASVFLFQCIAAHSSYATTAYGYYLHGDRINDVYMDSCEANFCTSGFYVDGSLVDVGYGADIHFRGCSADGCTNGFDINSLAVDSACEIVNGWSAASTIPVFVGYSSARIRVSGMQLYGGTSSLVAQDSSQMIITDNFILYPSTNGILLNNCPVSIVTNNQGFQKTATSANFISLTNNSIYCSIGNNVANASIANGWAYGVIATAGCNFLSVVGNSIPSGSAVTTPYTLNLSSNTGSYFAGTGTPN